MIGRFLRAWLPVLLFEATVLFLSSRPGGGLPALDIPHLDKVAHFGEYAALGWLLYRALRMSGGRRAEAAWGTIGMIALLGLGDETLQSRIPGRTSSVGDWLADVCGGSFGTFVGARWESRVPGLARRQNS